MRVRLALRTFHNLIKFKGARERSMKLITIDAATPASQEVVLPFERPWLAPLNSFNHLSGQLGVR